MNRKTWIVIIGSFLLLTLIIGTTTKVVQSLTYKEAIAVEVNSEQIDTGIRLNKESKSAKTFTSFRTIPSTSIEEIDVPIFEWAKGQEDAFYEEMNHTEEQLGKDFVAHFNLDTTVHKITDDLISIEMKAEQAVEQSNTYVTMKTFTIDLEREEIINLSDIFDESLFSTKDRFQLMVKMMDDKLDYEQWEPALENLDEMEVSVQSESFNFYFNQSELRNGEKSLQVDIPVIELIQYFSEEYYSTYVTEEMEADLEQMKLEQEQAKRDEIENHKFIALTFDDGPDIESTDRILDTLAEYDAKATFFMLSKNAEAYPEIAKRVADEGHEIANHSITHADLNAVNTDRIRQEMTESKTVIEQITGENPTLFRPPYGSKNGTVETIAQESDQAIALWSIDTYDWQHRNASRTIEKVKNQVRPGSVILMHDIHKTTADAVPQIMEYLAAEGYEFITMSELLPYIEGEGIGPYFGN